MGEGPTPAVRAVLEEWQLVAEGAPWEGTSSTLLRVRSDGEPAVLKVGRAGGESGHEHLALQHWRGEGAVRLLRADPRRRALLLERVGPADLAELGDVEACEVVAALYARLHVPAVPQLRRLSEVAAAWAARLGAVPRNAPIPHRLVDQARSLARSFAEDPDADGRLLHGDLHQGTVLAGSREPWLAVSPKPLSGDPHFEPAPLLHHGREEVVASGRSLSARGAVRRRFHAVVDAAGLDEDRARDWVVVRVVTAAVAELDRAAPDPSRTTVAVTVAKAVQD